MPATAKQFRYNRQKPPKGRELRVEMSYSQTPIEESFDYGPYIRLAVTLMLEAMNETIEKFWRWDEDLDWCHTLWPLWNDTRERLELKNVLPLVSGKDFYEAQDILNNYKDDWITEDPIAQFDNIADFLELLEISAVDCVLVAKELAFEEDAESIRLRRFSEYLSYLEIPISGVMKKKSLMITPTTRHHDVTPSQFNCDLRRRALKQLDNVEDKAMRLILESE